MKHKDLMKTHKAYDNNVGDWEFNLRSYLGGSEYQLGAYLLKYVNESDEEFAKRLAMTPLDNHCRNVVSIYSSFIWRIPPTRNLGSMANEKSVQSFLADADLDGRTLNAVMKDAQAWADIYGHCLVMVDKPATNAQTRAQELEQDIRPYLTIITPENVLDWEYTRSASGRYVLTYLKVREMQTADVTYVREWKLDTVTLYKTDGKKVTIESTNKNALSRITAVTVYSKRSPVRGVGVSSISDIAYMQKAIYNELSEIEQLIRIANHPSLVKRESTDANAGAGSIVTVMDGDDKPYLLQPNGGNLAAIMDSIEKKTEAINRMSHMGAVRGTEATTMSGVALQTEFQLLNANLTEKADLLELAEEQIWDFFALFQNLTNDSQIDYADSFDLRDFGSELEFLQKAKASGIKSATFNKGVEKAIAELVLADEDLKQAITEIEAQKTLGDFSTPALGDE